MAQKTPTATTDKTDITLLKKSTFKNLLGTATIENEIADKPDGIQVRLSNYSGTGYYSKAWVSPNSILDNLEKALPNGSS